MDILFWKNIQDLGERVDILQENTTLEMFGKVYDDTSLFHYFAGNNDVIEMIWRKHKTGMSNGTLSEAESKMPLLLLYPDKKGLSALDYAFQTQRQVNFSLMLEMLIPFNEICISKMML